MALSSASFWGQALEYAVTASDVLLDRNYRLHLVTPDAGGRSVKCPDPTNMTKGGVWFMVMNDSGSFSIDVKDHNGVSLGSLPAGWGAKLWLGHDTSGAASWFPGVPAAFTKGARIAGGALSYDVIISVDDAEVNIRAEVDAQGYDGTSIIVVNVVIESNVSVGALSTGTPAMRTGSFPAGVQIYIESSGNLDGAGGAGGDGGEYLSQVATVGGVGGNAFTADVACTFANQNGKIRAGGGGGGGGGVYNPGGGNRAQGGDGGGAQGRGGSAAGGPIGAGLPNYIAAAYGNPSDKGDGGHGGRVSGSGDHGTDGGDGGVFGGAGAIGEVGAGGAPAETPGAGGVGGSATEGDSLITFTSLGVITGARNG